MRFCPRCGGRYEHERFCPEDGAATEPLPEAGPPKDALLGTLIDGRYRIDAQIGEGGMGVVYKATHVALNKTLALKVLRGDVARDPEVVQRFIQEAQAATSIGHENIVDISDFGRLKDGTAYFVMEYLNGRALNEMITRGGSLPMRDAVQILRQVADALGAAHARGIIHRDLKPDNVFVLKRGELENFVKVLDFGIAKVGSTKNKLTRTGMVFGTPHYMSPEQAAGQSVDARTDIYALGVMMYEMFTGRVPFEADTFMGVMTKHMFEKPAPMFRGQTERQLGALEQITLRALEKKPENRYDSMAALVADLECVAGGGSLRPVAGQRPSQELADALEPRSKSELHLEQLATSAAPGPPTTKRPPWVVRGAIGVVAIVALLLLLVFRRGGSEEPAGVALQADGAIEAPPLPALPSPANNTTGGAVSAVEPRALASIALTSQPSGADIVVDGAIIGRTPAELPRPEQGARSIELRLEGYTRELLELHADSPSKIDIALKKKPPPASLRPPPPASPSPRKRPPPTKRYPLSDVVDPWAN